MSIQHILAQIYFFFLFVVNRVGCIYANGGKLKLQCNNLQRIQVVTATVGQSSQACRNESRCCPSVDDYSVLEPTLDVKYLKDICDGQQTCDVRVGQLTERYTTDYESVNYIVEMIP